MSRLPVKLLSKVQNFLWNYGTASLAIFRASKCWGHSVLQTLALVDFGYLEHDVNGGSYMSGHFI